MRKVVHFEIPADDVERAKTEGNTLGLWRAPDVVLARRSARRRSVRTR
jgi:hypothetical protein